jgi:hypothetical protein
VEPHLLHVGLRHGLTLAFECLAASPIANGCATWYRDDRGVWVPRDECWVTHHVLDCVTEGMDVAEFLEELGDYGPITGPIPVRVWNEGDFEECIPRMAVAEVGR